MINLKLETSADKHKADKNRKLVTTATTLVLVIYVVVVSGIVGWVWYSGTRETATSAEQEELIKKVAAKSESEVMVRKLDTRIKQIGNFFANSQSAASVAGTLVSPEVGITSWDYDTSTGKQVILAVQTDPDVLARYAGGLTQRYATVVVGPTVWDPASGWQMTIKASGDKLK